MVKPVFDVKQPSFDIEMIAKQISQEIIDEPHILHEKKDLPDPIKGITKIVRKTLRDHYHSKHEIIIFVEYPLTADLHDLPQMLLLQLYKALSNSSLHPYIPENFFNRVEAICMRIYYSVTYKYDQTQIDAMEQTLNAERSHNQSSGISVEGTLNVLKAVMEWRQSLSNLSSTSFVKRFQKVFSTTKTHTQKDMSASEAMSILDNLLETMEKLSVVFCYQPILEADEMIREKLANQTILDKTWIWLSKTIVGDAVALVLYIPLLIVKTSFNFLQFIALFMPFKRIVGKKKFRVLFIANGYDRKNTESEKALSQLKSLLHNPNSMVLLIHEVV